MTSKGFVMTCLASIVVMVSAIVGVDYAIDIYGVFHGSDARPRRVYTNEPVTKYLFARKYIPGNFDGLLVGTSITQSLDLSKVPNYRLYNASLSGGNTATVTPVIRVALERGRYRLVIMCVYPYMTKDHQDKTTGLDDRQVQGALGSPQLFRDYLAAILVEKRVIGASYDASGTRITPPAARDADDAVAELLAEVKRNGGTPDLKSVGLVPDPVALEQYRDLIDRAHQNGATILALIPPWYTKRREVYGTALDDYKKVMLGLFAPNDLVLDLNDPRFASLTDDPSNFQDGAHLSAKGNEAVVQAIAQFLASGG